MNRWVRMAIFPLMGIAAYWILTSLQARMKLGDYAESPQKIELLREQRKVIAGGRAGLELIGSRNGKTKVFIRCLQDGEAIQRELTFREGESQSDRCGVEVQLLAVHGESGARAEFEVRWE